MTIEQIIKLTEAGFTAAEIKEFFPKEPETKEPETKEPETIDSAHINERIIEDFNKKIESLTKAVQAANILNSSTHADVSDETTNDILRSIINGGKNENGGK